MAQSVAKSLSDSIQGISEGRRISLTRLEKANGENAQVSYHTATGQWVVCSKTPGVLTDGPDGPQLK